jgi:pimeloyl-ACP methyl ester carboxylesterase
MQLHFKSDGSGDPLIILHGLFGMLDNWQSFASNLHSSYYTHLIDLRNHGRSPQAPEMSYELMAEDLRETMESQWMHDGAFVIGHSMGGKVAMQLALSYPDLVKCLVIVDIAPVTYKGGHEAIIEALLKVPIDLVTSRSQVSEILDQEIKNSAITGFLMKNLLRRKDGSFSWRMNLTSIAAHYRDLLAAPTWQGIPYRGPTLFVKGGSSDYLSKKSETEVFKFFPSATITTIEGAGHWVHADEPAKLLHVVMDFLSAHG